MLRLSLSTGTFYHVPLRTTLSLARQVGFDGVELVLGPEAILRGPGYVRGLSREYNLPVLSLHPPIAPFPGMRDATRTVPWLVDFARRVECGLIVLHTPKTTSTNEPVWTRFVEAIVLQRSDPDVRVSLENGGFFRPSDGRFLLHDIRRLCEFAERYDLPLTLDTAHAGTSGYDLLEVLALYGRRVANVHFSDLARRRVFPDWPPLYTFFLHHQMPGEGELPLREFLSALLCTGYSGILTLELSPTAVGAWHLGRARQALNSAVCSLRSLELEP